MNKEIEKAFEFMINQKPVKFSKKGVLEIKKTFGLIENVWIIKSINYHLEIEIESTTHFHFSGLGLEMFNFK